MSELIVMGSRAKLAEILAKFDIEYKSGDTRWTWREEEPESVAVAEGVFDVLVKEQRYAAFATMPLENSSVLVEGSFPRQAEKIYLVRQPSGG